MFFIKDDNFLSDLSKRYIHQSFLNVGFPYYYGGELIIDSEEHIPFLAHVIKKRDDDLINSDCYQDCVNMIVEFTEKHKIKYKEILRMAVNFTYPNGFEKCPIHQDHPFPHKQLLIYLNDPQDKNARTVILGNNKKYEIQPQQYRAICFENKPHFHYFPKVGERIVLVTTFK